jgi:hypothetical protein
VLNYSNSGIVVTRLQDGRLRKMEWISSRILYFPFGANGTLGPISVISRGKVVEV